MANDLVAKNSSVGSLKSVSDDWGLTMASNVELTIRCDVGQPTSRGGREQGKFNFSSPDWKPVEKLENVVIVYPGRTRVLFGKGFDDPRRCGSDDYKVPSQFILKPVSPSCDICPLSKWDSELSSTEAEFKRRFETELDVKKSDAPLCTDTINMVVVDGRMMPFTLKFQRTQIKLVTEKLINRIMYKGKRPYQIMFDVGLLKKENAKGSWYEYVFDNFRDIPEADQSAYQQLFSFFKANGTRILAENHASMDQEKEVAKPIEDVSIDLDAEEIPF